MMFRGFNSLFLPVVLVLLSACGAGSGKNVNSEDPLAQVVPNWSGISYTSNGRRVTLTPPYLVTQNIFADPATGSCTGNQMELVFSGSYNPDKVSDVVLSGLTTTVQYSANSFSFTACMAPGSVAVTITTYDKSKKAVRSPLTVSISAMASAKTLGFGSPSYPNTGFSMGSAMPHGPITSGSTKLSNVHMGSLGKATTASTGRTGFSMETGFANYVQQASP